MQQPFTRRDVYEPSLTATIGGQAVEVAAVSMDRALPDPLAGGQLRSASGTIATVEGPDATTTVATPWDPATQWPPAPQTGASVSMGTGDGEVALLGDGVVVSSAGGTGAREVEVEVADRYESLNRTISWGPFADATPSESEGVNSRYVGLHSIHVTDRVLRHCGWYATPPSPGYAVLSVPAQGSMWPETGRVDEAQGLSGAYPGFLNTPWGVGVSDADAMYTLAGAYSIQSRGRVELTAMTTDRAGEGASRIDLMNGDGVLLARMAWSATSGHLWLRNAAGEMVAAASVPRSAGLLYATVERVSSTSVYVTIRSGGQSVGAAATVDQVVVSSVMRRARIYADSTSGGFLVAFPGRTGTLESWTPNAVIYPRTSGRNTLRVLWPVEAANCATLLAEQCEAECATYWIDETGVLRWWDLARLEAQSPVATLTSDDDIDEDGFQWRHDLSQVKSRVAVKWEEPLRDWSWRTTVDLYQGSGETVQPNTATTADPAEGWITVPDDEIWVMPDLSLSRADITTTTPEFNNGIGSFYGGVIPGAEDTPDKWAPGSGTLQMTIQRITDQTFKTSLIWTGPDPAVLKTLAVDTASNLWRIRRDFDLPIIRGKAKFTLAEQVTYSVQTGPGTAPEHVIEAGRWIQRPEQAQYTADYAAARLTVPQPVLSSVALVPVPGLQLGDMVTVEDTHVTRLTVRGIVVSDSRSIRDGMDMSHAVAIRPTSVTRNSVTWEEWGRFVQPDTHQAWGQRQQPDTWQTWGQDPLEED